MKATLRGVNTKKETQLKGGDIIAYDEATKSIILWRPIKGKFLMERLQIDGDDNFYFLLSPRFPLAPPNSLFDVVSLISGCTGLSFEETKACRPQYAFRFTNP